MLITILSHSGARNGTRPVLAVHLGTLAAVVGLIGVLGILGIGGTGRARSASGPRSAAAVDHYHGSGDRHARWANIYEASSHFKRQLRPRFQHHRHPGFEMNRHAGLVSIVLPRFFIQVLSRLD